MNLREIMSSPVITVPETCSLATAARTMLEKKIGALVVVDESGNLSGIITESDFAAKKKGVPFSTFCAPQVLGKWLSDADLEQIYSDARHIPVTDIMTRRVVTAAEDETVGHVVRLMLEHDINRVPITSEEKPVGIVARHDLLRLLADSAATATK